MKIWFRLMQDKHVLKDTIVEYSDDRSRTKKIFAGLEEACHLWDLAVPIWLDINIREFRQRAGTRFSKDNFTEHIDFDYMEIKVLEED